MSGMMDRLSFVGTTVLAVIKSRVYDYFLKSVNEVYFFYATLTNKSQFWIGFFTFVI